MDLEYECNYTIASRKRCVTLPEIAMTTIASPRTSTLQPQGMADVSGEQPSPMNANSGAAFVQELAISLDPLSAPRMALYAWNVFGSHQLIQKTNAETTLLNLLTQSDMETLATAYFQKVDPCYGFIERQVVNDHITRRWSLPRDNSGYDPIICGVAALGCLFSEQRAKDLELGLAELARIVLERDISQRPSVHSITAWVLRVAYLRMTSEPHTAWMASNLLMHMIEATALHREPVAYSNHQHELEGAGAEERRRLFGVAQHLNTWISFDIGRSRVTIRNATTILPRERQNGYTIELLALHKYSEMLDSSEAPTLEKLGFALAEVLQRRSSQPPSTLAKTNLALCLYRRLRATGTPVPGPIMSQLLELTAEALRSAQTLLDSCSPWHHISNIPFQVICTLLAIDSPASLAQLEDAMQTLQSVATRYNTPTLKEAVQTAAVLVRLQHRRKDADSARLGNVLKQHNPTDALALEASQNPEARTSQQWWSPNSAFDPNWLDEAVAGNPLYEDFDIEAFLGDDFR